MPANVRRCPPKSKVQITRKSKWPTVRYDYKHTYSLRHLKSPFLFENNKQNGFGKSNENLQLGIRLFCAFSVCETCSTVVEYSYVLKKPVNLLELAPPTDSRIFHPFPPTKQLLCQWWRYQGPYMIITLLLPVKFGRES